MTKYILILILILSGCATTPDPDAGIEVYRKDRRTNACPIGWILFTNGRHDPVCISQMDAQQMLRNLQRY